MLYARRKWKFIYSPQTIDHLQTKFPLDSTKTIGTRHLQEIRLDGKTKEMRLSRKASLIKSNDAFTLYFEEIGDINALSKRLKWFWRWNWFRRCSILSFVGNTFCFLLEMIWSFSPSVSRKTISSEVRSIWEESKAIDRFPPDSKANEFIHFLFAQYLDYS